MPFESLFEDEFTKDILSKTSEDVKEVQLYADGTWKELGKEKDEKDFVDLTSDGEEEIHDLTAAIKPEDLGQLGVPFLDISPGKLASPSMMDASPMIDPTLLASLQSPMEQSPSSEQDGWNLNTVSPQQKTPEEEFADQALSLDEPDNKSLQEVDTWIGLDLNDSFGDTSTMALGNIEAYQQPQTDPSTSMPGSDLAHLASDEGMYSILDLNGFL